MEPNAALRNCPKNVHCPCFTASSLQREPKHKPVPLKHTEALKITVICGECHTGHIYKETAHSWTKVKNVGRWSKPQKHPLINHQWKNIICFEIRNWTALFQSQEFH